MRYIQAIFHLVMFCMLGIFSGCGGPGPQRVSQEPLVVAEYTFAAPYDLAWQGTVRAVAEADRISTLDKESGIIVTDYRTINKLVRNMVDGTTFGKVYKNSYSVNLSEDSPGKTRIRVKANLILEELTVYDHELEDGSMKAYMRQELFRKICIHLDGDARKCTALFPDYHMVSASCLPPPAGVGSGGQSPSPPATAAQPTVVNIRKMQQALSRAGYEPGQADGIVGPKTMAALRRFQQDKGIEGDGAVNFATLQALGF